MKSPNTFLAFVLISVLFIIQITLGNTCLAQGSSNYRIAFYNLENLFHPENDSLKNDDAFTPEGDYHWNSFRYREKCNRMAKAILSIGAWEPPALVGVAEVENRTALVDLVSTDVLKKFNYEIIHYESPDRRGIDVGMIYRSDLFKVYTSKAIPVKLSGDSSFATRDILYVKGSFEENDTIHVFVNHWPSRYGGQAQSEPKRIAAAITLRSITDSLYQLSYATSIVIVGDFNDEWSNVSLKDTLINPSKSKPYLTNLMPSMPIQTGSHRYRGVWTYLDQIIVSNNLLDNTSPIILKTSPQVSHLDFLLTTDDRYPGKVPFRTFVGRKYKGGFSDHLPVYIDIVY